MSAMDVVSELNKELLKQDFPKEQLYVAELNRYKEIAYNYACLENSLSVLSDMHTNISYVFYGGFAKQLGISQVGKDNMVHSIWEEDILKLMHPEDLKSKYLQELRFFHYMKHLPKSKRYDYYFVSRLRMKDTSGNYLPIMHRMFYISIPSSNGIRFALCLYNPLTFDVSQGGIIVNSITGDIQELETHNDTKILSDREKQVLRLIDKGFMSKSIADLLSISINTVSRHRQEILKKFQVNNSIEACRIAKDLGIL